MKSTHSTLHLSNGIVLWKAVANLAQAYALSHKDLEDVLGFSQTTLSRLYQKGGGINPQSKEGELVLLLIRLYRSLSANLGGDDEAAKAWLRSHNHYFNESPLEHIRKITGLVEVLSYLDAMRKFKPTTVL
jgi:hypothetical protein